MSVSGGSVTEATISGLTPSTNYSIEVAAVNNIGTGVYSSPMIAETHMNKYTLSHRTCVYVDYFNLQVYSSV